MSETLVYVCIYNNYYAWPCAITMTLIVPIVEISGKCTVHFADVLYTNGSSEVFLHLSDGGKQMQ